MHSIYRIVCRVSGKCYVGEALIIKRRKQEHFKQLRSGYHHSYRLQYAFDKYGESEFDFEILETGISNDEIEKREQYWIHHFNSFENGYNCTNGGIAPPRQGIEIEWNGHKYKTIREASNALGYPYTTLQRYISKGFKGDSDIRGRTRSCEWNGVSYNSIQEAATANNVSIVKLHNHIQKGHKCDSDIRPHLKTCIWNDVEYKSISLAAKENGVSFAVMHWRLSQGYKSNSDVKIRPKERQ